MESVRYQCAINSNGKTVNVEKLVASAEVRHEQFKCISCDNLLVPVLGEKRKKHFRHKVDIEIKCSRETYLHKLAKLKFREVYQKCVDEKTPFWIEIDFTQHCNFYQKEFLHTCTFMKGKQKFNLTKHFQDIKLEKKDSSFIPDLLLTSQYGDNIFKIFVEIAVTHKSTPEKILSEHRIIELSIDVEDDIKMIDEKFLSESDKVKFFNFQRLETRNFCSGRCKEAIKPYATGIAKYNFFAIFPNGKCAIIRDKLTWPQGKDILYHEIVSIDNEENNISNVFLRKIVESHLNLLPVKNCFICRYHGKNLYHYYEDKPIFCKFLKKACNSNEAANCEYYRPDLKSIHDANFF